MEYWLHFIEYVGLQIVAHCGVAWRGMASRGETKRDITAGRLTQGAVNRAGAGPIDTARDSPALWFTFQIIKQRIQESNAVIDY